MGSSADTRKPGVPEVGDVIAQKYRVETFVGRGGMGTVVAARHLQLDQVVAIKLLTLPADDERHDEAVARFVQEAQAAGRLQNDHVVRIYDVGQLESGLPFMVMELLSGSDLSSILDAEGPLPEATAVDYVLQACAGIAEAHRAGIVHRDLKPSNLFLTRRSDGLPLVKVLDFGISKRLADPDGGQPATPLTSTRTIMGSPHYMSPEQVRDTRRVDQRTDIWALGTILQELLTGDHVFNGESFPGVCASIVVDPPAPIGLLRPDLTPGVVAAIQRCLEKDPERRFQSVDELSSALAAFGSRMSASGGHAQPVTYGSRAHKAAVLPSVAPAETGPGHALQTATLATSVDPTLESARLPRAARSPSGGTQTSMATSERVRVVSTQPAPSAGWPRRLALLAVAALVGAGWLWLLSGNPESVPTVASQSAEPKANEAQSAPGSDSLPARPESSARLPAPAASAPAPAVTQTPSPATSAKPRAKTPRMPASTAPRQPPPGAASDIRLQR